MGRSPEKRRARRKRAVPISAQRKTAAKLSLRKQRTAKAFVEEAHGVKAVAARIGGYKESTATKQQARIFGDPAVQGEIGEHLREKGLTNEVVAQRMREAADAPFVTKAGEVVKDAPDSKIRLAACELFLKATGQLKDRVEIESVANHWSERIALVVELHACPQCKAKLLDAIIGELSTPGG